MGTIVILVLMVEKSSFPSTHIKYLGLKGFLFTYDKLVANLAMHNTYP